MAAIDDKENDGTISKVEAWLSKTFNQLSCDAVSDVTESYQKVRLRKDKLRQMKVALTS
jgi:hypothetical protein